MNPEYKDKQEKKRFVYCRLEVVGDPDDGMTSIYTGCIDGNNRKSIAVINDKLIVDRFSE